MDHVVGDLVGRLKSKLENDGNKQTQEYSKEVQPINNTSTSSITGPLVQIYNDGTKKEDKKPDATPSETKEGRSAAEDFGIQTASAVTGLLGVGALGVAYNTDAATKAKLKLKKVGGGILGAVTSVGAAINNNILKRGNKLGKGEKLADGEKVYEKSGKPGTYAKLVDEEPLSQADFDKFLEKNLSKTKKKLNFKQADTPTPTLTPIKENAIVPKPANTPTPTPIKNSIFSPSIRLSQLKPQKMFSSEAPTLDIFKAGNSKSNIMEPVETQLKKLNAGERLKASVKRKIVQLDVNGLRKEATKIQKVARNYIERKRGRPSTTLNLAPVEPEITLAPTPPVTVARARKSGVQQSDKVATRSKTAQSGVPLQAKMEKQPRKIYPSDVGEYRSGQRERAKDIAKNTEKPFVPVWDFENLNVKGYFSKELTKPGRPKSSILSVADTPAPVKRNLSNYMKEKK